MDFLIQLRTILEGSGIVVLFSVPVCIAATQYVSKRLLDQWLSRRLQDHEASHHKELAEFKARVESQFRKELEEHLAERSTERAYRAEARKRLYVTVGQLRFQLLIAAAELANRTIGIGNRKYGFDPSIENYFGQSTIYRILRVFAVSALIERQIAYADFAVDSEMRSLLTFRRRAFASLSSSRVSLGHPLENWDEQEHHIYYDNLQIIGSSLIVQEANSLLPGRVMDFAEFSEKVTDDTFKCRLDPLPRLMSNFSASSKPIVWLRLLALSHLCVQLLQTYGSHLGLEYSPIDIDKMLSLSEDKYILQNRERYREAIAGFDIAHLAVTT